MMPVAGGGLPHLLCDRCGCSHASAINGRCPCGNASWHGMGSSGWGDKWDQWSTRIAAAHPANNGSDATYMTAMEMVGNRHSKAALVELVNWILQGQP